MTLWNDGFVARSETEAAPARVVLNVGYAMRGAGYPGLLTPFAEIKLNDSEQERRRYGVQWTPKRNTGVQLAIEDDSDAAVRLTARHRW